MIQGCVSVAIFDSLQLKKLPGPGQFCLFVSELGFELARISDYSVSDEQGQLEMTLYNT